MPINFDNITLTGGRKYNPSDLSALNNSLSYLPTKQRAAVLASILEESQGNPMSISNNKTYQGLLQWGADRYQIKNKGNRELANQLQYLKNTIDNPSDHISWTNGGKGSGYKSFKDTYADFHNQSLPLDKVLRAFSYGYVRPYGKEDSFNNRLKVAKQIYSRLSTPGIPVNYIAQPDALRVARPIIPPTVPSRITVPVIPNAYAEGGMLYGNQEDMSSTPHEEYQQEGQENTQETPRQWDELSLAEKNAFIASAVKHGITNMEDIRNAYDELVQEQMNGNSVPEEAEDNGNKFLKGGYKPSKYIRSYISHMEGASMKTNRSFADEANSFWSVLPEDVRSKLTQEQADALYSYSYNVGAGNFKNRVVPALERYFSGKGSVEDVQRHMYATKDSQLRGLAKRRAEERAMFAGSEVPVYYDTPNMGNEKPLNGFRLGPVSSINMSKGLGLADNDKGLLGPVGNKRQDNGLMKEAINALYDDSKPMLMQAPQDEPSSLDRYNAIQDYLSSLSSFGYANGGKLNAKLGVVSSNGQYHVNPSEYTGVLDNASTGRPLEVTLPDTTVTAADPRNYRSYYDPNGVGDFVDVTTLGLFPNPFNLSRSASTFMQHPSWDSAWDTTKNTLMFAGSTGKEGAFVPLGIMNLIDKDGARKTYGLAKNGNYAGAAMSGLGDAINAGMAAKPIYTVGKNYVNNVEKRIAETFMRTTPAYNPLYEAENGFINIWNGLNGGKPRLAHIANYWFTGHKTGPKGYYNSFAGFNPYNESQLVSNPTFKERLQGFIHPEGTSFAYSGFSSSAGKVPAIKGGNDLIDAYLYSKDIDPIYGVKKIAQGKDFGVHSDFIKNNYADKADNIPVYEMNTPSRYSDSDIKSSNIWHPAEGGLFDTGSFNTSVNAAGHLYKEGITSYGKPVVMQQDIWKFKPDDYYTKWFGNYNITPFMKNVIKFGLKEVDRLGTPVITRTKWIDKNTVKMRPIE